MNRLIIIDTYPNSEKQLNILSRCIDSLKTSGYDIMIVSHLPLPENITLKVNYVIFDSNNTFLDSMYTPFWWMQSDKFRIEIYNAGHTLPICRNMRSSLNLAHVMSYNQFIFMESDIIFDSEDLSKLIYYLDEMTVQNKKMLFFKPEGYRDCDGSYVYETLLFGGETKFFIDKFNPPLNLEEWMNIPMGYTLELSFYEQFSKYEHQYYILDDHSSNIFYKSQVNIFRYGLFNVEVAHNMVNEDNPHLFIINSLINDETKPVIVLRNNEIIHKTNLGKGHFWLQPLSYDDSLLEVIVYENLDMKEEFMKKIFHLNINNMKNFKLKSILNFI